MMRKTQAEEKGIWRKNKALWPAYHNLPAPVSRGIILDFYSYM